MCSPANRIMSFTSGRDCDMAVVLPAGVTAVALADARLARIDETRANPKAKFRALGKPAGGSARGAGGGEQRSVGPLDGRGCGGGWHAL